MTDKDNNEIDLTKEIEELDGFLNDQDVDFPLDEDDSDFGIPNFALGAPTEQEKKSNMSKFIGYLFLLCLLFGGAYLVYLFAPQFIRKPQFEKVQKFISNESGDIVGDFTNMFKSNVLTSDGISDVAIQKENEVYAPQEPIDTVSELPMPSDRDLIDTDELLSIADATEFMPKTAGVINDPIAEEKQAGVIRENLESKTPNVPNFDFELLEKDMVEVVNETRLDFANEVPNAPITDLPALKDDLIEVASNVMQISSEDLMDIVESVENLTPEKVVEIAEDMHEERQIPTAQRENSADMVENVTPEDVVDVVEETQDATPVEIIEIAEEIKEEKRIPSAPKIEMPAVEIQTKKAVPVKVSAPRVVSQSKASGPTDSRVVQAKSLYDKGDYNGALNLYRAVLQSDPANTSALTGRQLAQAKLRMAGQALRSVTRVDVKTSEPKRVSVPIVQNKVPSAPVTKRTAQPSGNLQALLQQAQANPKDAMRAFKVGNAYKDADNTKALEWYRKALQLDVFTSSGLDRMSVYDAMADIQ